MGFLVSWASQSGAQTVVDRNGSVRTRYGDSVYQSEPYGGFGLESVQTPFAGSVWVDQFGFLHFTAPAQPSPRVSAVRPRPKATGSAASRRVSPTKNRLPTGSLYWPGSSGVILYSPGLRYQSYGGGYGLGPYGSIDCGIMYKGMSLGY